jgi:hypothetical protein
MAVLFDEGGAALNIGLMKYTYARSGIISFFYQLSCSLSQEITTHHRLILWLYLAFLRAKSLRGSNCF